MNEAEGIIFEILKNVCNYLICYDEKLQKRFLLFYYKFLLRQSENCLSNLLFKILWDKMLGNDVRS